MADETRINEGHLDVAFGSRASNFFDVHADVAIADRTSVNHLVVLDVLIKPSPRFKGWGRPINPV